MDQSYGSCTKDQSYGDMMDVTKNLMHVQGTILWDSECSYMYRTYARSQVRALCQVQGTVVWEICARIHIESV